MKGWGNRTSCLVKAMICSTSSNCCDSCMSGWSGWVFKLEDIESSPYSPWAKITQTSPNSSGKSSHVTSKPSQTWSLGNPQFLLDAQTMTPNRLEDTQPSKVTSVGSTQEQSLQWCSITLGFVCLGLGFGFSSLDDFRSKSSEDGMLSNDKCRFLLEQPTS